MSDEKYSTNVFSKELALVMLLVKMCSAPMIFHVKQYLTGVMKTTSLLF